MYSKEDNANREHKMPISDISYTEYASGITPHTTSSSASSTQAPLKPSARFLTSHIAHFLSLGAGSGLSPVAPGTVGTLYAWLSFILLNRWFDDAGWAIVISLGFVVGLWCTAFTARALRTQDPGAIVWDEVVAFWLVMWLIAPATFGQQCVAFALFRYFDAAKPGPVGWADRRFKGGLGIMLDDLIAAACTLFVIALWQRSIGA